MTKPHWDTSRNEWLTDDDLSVDPHLPYTDKHGITWTFEPMDDNGYYAWVPTRESKTQPQCECGADKINAPGHSSWCPRSDL